VTYTTQGDVTFLENLVPLSAVWDGPISFAIYSPGSDFQVAAKSIAYLRQCHTNVRNKVNFHLVMDAGHTVNMQSPNINIMHDCINQPAPWLSLHKTYRQLHQLQYPINVLRNVARMNAETFYVLASDIELYPSANLVHLFMQMMQRRLRQRISNKKVVFVLPPFEVFANQTIPTNKNQLVIYFSD
jgi:N-acetyllactosaminide beta-1,3-N-acetylglucosaminyltransferase